MAVSNIEKFDDITGKIFAELYQSFPVPQTLMTEDFVGSVLRYNEKYGTELPTDDAEFFFATATWLMHAGYITGTPRPPSYVTEAVLSAKGLEVLKAVPKSVTSKSSIGEQLAVSAKEGGKEAARGLVSEAFSIGVKIISPMIGLS